MPGFRSHADDWPHWRGSNRNDIVDESSGWNGGDWPIRELWKAGIGEGASSPLIVGDRLFTMGWHDGNDHVVCLDAATGTELWRQSYPCPKYGRLATGDEGLYSGPSSTPEYDAQTGWLYTLSTDGDLLCWNTREQGRRIWGLNLHDEFDIPQRPQVERSGLRDYGYTSSPLIHGQWVIVEVGAKQGNLMAFDRQTGRKVWASQATSPPGHNGGPVPITVENVPCVAVHNFDGLQVVRMDSGHEGETVATYPWITSFANNIASVAVHDDCVLLTSAYNQNRISRLRITLNGAVEVWQQQAASKICTPVIHKGHVYWAWQNLMCLDYETGDIKWQGGRCGDAGSCVVTSDDRLIMWTGNGDLTLTETAVRSPDQFTELASRKGVGRADAWPHVVLAAGRLYCRDRSGPIVCFQMASGR
ncbi:MAG: PQQ-binding-like beta-propeller repeat protein [Planctomycetaceae bacterium]